MKRGIKIALIISGVVVALLILLIVFISPITKYLIEKHSEEYTGRVIRIDKFAINIFNGSITAKGFTVYEAKSKTIFCKIDQLDLNITVYKLWGGKYDITSVSVNKPFVRIIQKGDQFNYDDLIKRFLTADTTQKKVQAKPRTILGSQYYC